MKLRFLIGSFLVIFLAPLARADILFIDLNCSAAEIAAAKKAAAARGEKLVLLPPRTAKQQREYAELHDLDLSLEHVTTQATAQRLSDREDALKAQVAKDPEGQPSFSLDQVEQVLRQYSKHHKTFETVIISGHHVGEFFGQFGTLEEKEIPNAFSKYPKLFQAVHGYYGWGCYTNTPSEADKWEKAFPNLHMTGGFDGSAPGGDTLADGDFLAAILAKETQLERQAVANPSKQEMDRMAKVIRAIHDFNLVNGAVCTCGECVGKNTGIMNLTQFESCDSDSFDALENASSALDFAHAWGPPCNTGNSDLRHFYNLTRQKAYCATANSELSFGTYTNEADAALHMIYMKQILANVDLYYADQLQTAKTVAATCGTKLPDFQSPLACVAGRDPTNPAGPTFDSHASNELHFDTLSVVPDKIMSMVSDCQMTPAEKNTLAGLICVMSSLEELPASWVEPAAHRSELQTPRLDCEVPE